MGFCNFSQWNPLKKWQTFFLVTKSSTHTVWDSQELYDVLSVNKHMCPNSFFPFLVEFFRTERLCNVFWFELSYMDSKVCCFPRTYHLTQSHVGISICALHMMGKIKNIDAISFIELLAWIWIMLEHHIAAMIIILLGNMASNYHHFGLEGPKCSSGSNLPMQLFHTIPLI